MGAALIRKAVQKDGFFLSVWVFVWFFQVDLKEPKFKFYSKCYEK